MCYVHGVPPTVLVDLTPLDTPTRVRGIGRYLKTLALGLSRIGAQADMRLLALRSLDWVGRFEVSERFTLEEAPSTSFPTQADRYRWAYARRVALWKAMHELDASLVHLGDPNATPLGLGFTPRRRVVTCHDLIPLQFPERYLGPRDGYGLIGKHLIRRRFRSADHVIAISDATKREVERLVGVPADRVSRVYNGVDLSMWSHEDPGDDAARVKAQGLVPMQYVLYVGDTDWRKNVEGMVGGVAAARKAGADVMLAFAGRLEPEKVQRIRDLAKRAGVEDAVRILGYVSDDDLRALFRSALAHLFVSRSEGFGYTVVEAMASGCPVITTRCGSLAEVAGDAALLVDPDDVAAIGQAIIRVSTDDRTRAELQHAGLERAVRFSCEEQARMTLRVFARVLS